MILESTHHLRATCPHLDHVSGQRVGTADEAEHGGLVSDNVPELVESLSHEGACLLWVDGVHPLHLQEPHTQSVFFINKRSLVNPGSRACLGHDTTHRDMTYVRIAYATRHENAKNKQTNNGTQDSLVQRGMCSVNSLIECERGTLTLSAFAMPTIIGPSHPCWQMTTALSVDMADVPNERGYVCKASPKPTID